MKVFFCHAQALLSSKAKRGGGKGKLFFFFRSANAVLIERRAQHPNSNQVSEEKEDKKCGKLGLKLTACSEQGFSFKNIINELKKVSCPRGLSSLISLTKVAVEPYRRLTHLATEPLSH